MNLQDLVILSARQAPDAVAVKGTDTTITYRELDTLSNCFAHLLINAGVRTGDRVGIWNEKTACTIAAMQGTLRIGAIYVPLDPLSPAARINSIITDCSMRALITTSKRLEGLQNLAGDLHHVAFFCIDDRSPCSPAVPLASTSSQAVSHQASDNDIAYILYTSGSTGTPKGVCISHRNALAFIEWAAEVLQASPTDHFANHAPFHFDLSVLDLYVAFKTGASVYLITDSISYMPGQLVKFLLQEALTIWYSVPSVLILMIEQAGLLEQDIPELRMILFAGEPFPMKHLSRLFHRFKHIRFLNLYGPTETNVCTYYEVREIPEGQNKPVPIGSACSGDTVWAIRNDGEVAQPGEEGELVVSGPTVMVGYWGRPPHGDRPYATGDLVRLHSDGNYSYLGRRDHMVKVRGYRVEIGDIEAALETHPLIHEAAVIVAGTGIEARLIAFLVGKDTLFPSLLEMKRYCAERLPRYMIIDAIHAIPALPRTRNGKIDRLSLRESLANS